MTTVEIGIKIVENKKEIPSDVQLVHSHICTVCGRAARREDPDGMPDAAGVFHCSRCGHEGPLNEAIIEERDERLLR